MKNILIIDGAVNCVYDIFQAEDEEFAILFPEDTDIAFIDEIQRRVSEDQLTPVMNSLWNRPIPKRDAMGIHGTIFTS